MVDCTGLENRQGCKLLVGSNPTPSAIIIFATLRRYRAARRKSSDSGHIVIVGFRG